MKFVGLRPLRLSNKLNKILKQTLLQNTLLDIVSLKLDCNQRNITITRVIYNNKSNFSFCNNGMIEAVNKVFKKFVNFCTFVLFF